MAFLNGLRIANQATLAVSGRRQGQPDRANVIQDKSVRNGAIHTVSNDLPYGVSFASELIQKTVDKRVRWHDVFFDTNVFIGVEENERSTYIVDRSGLHVTGVTGKLLPNRSVAWNDPEAKSQLAKLRQLVEDQVEPAVEPVALNSYSIVDVNSDIGSDGAIEDDNVGTRNHKRSG